MNMVANSNNSLSSVYEKSSCSQSLRIKLVSKLQKYQSNKLTSLPLDAPLEMLINYVAETTSLAAVSFALFWVDNEGDMIALQTNEDWKEAVQSYLNLSFQIQRMKIHVNDVCDPTPDHKSEGCISSIDSASESSQSEEPFSTSSTFTLYEHSGAWRCLNDLTEPSPEKCPTSNDDKLFVQRMAPMYVSNPTGTPQVLANCSFDSAGSSLPNSISPSGSALPWTRGRVLGKGSYGTVYMGLNQRTGELLAVKEVRFDMDTSKELEKLQCLRQEINMLEQLEHPNIVHYIGTDRTWDAFYIFMEYIPGGSIASLLRQFGPFQERVMQTYIKQVTQGLRYLHEQGVSHNDIKGANILVSSNGEVKLADFGSSRWMQDLVSSSSKSSFCGTLEWMAPESISGLTSSPASDIWSLGCTILEMAYADTPWSHSPNPNRFGGLSAIYYIANGNERPVFPNDLSGAALDFLDQCLQRDVQVRATINLLEEHQWLQSPVPLTARSYSKHVLMRSVTEDRLELILKTTRQGSRSTDEAYLDLQHQFSSTLSPPATDNREDTLDSDKSTLTGTRLFENEDYDDLENEEIHEQEPQHDDVPANWQVMYLLGGILLTTSIVCLF